MALVYPLAHNSRGVGIMEKVFVGDKVVHLIQLVLILATSVILILFAHQWIPPDVVYTGMISGISGVIGSRIAGNNYQTKEKPLGNIRDTQ